MVQGQGGSAGLAHIAGLCAQARAVRQGFVGVTGVEPAAVVVEHDIAEAVVVLAVKVDTGAVALSLVKIGIKGEIAGQRPVNGGAPLHPVFYLARRQTQDGTRVQQVIERGAGGHVAGGLVVPVAQQFAFASGEQVIAPWVVVVAPVGRFIDQLRRRAANSAVFDQANLDFVNTAGQGAGIEALQTGGNQLGIDQQAVAVDLCRCRTTGGDIHRVYAGFGLIDDQAVGTAIHDAHCGIGAGAKSANLPGQTFGAWSEIAQAQKCTFQFTLGVGFIDSMFELTLVRTIHACELQVERLAPVADAAAGLQAITTVNLLSLAGGEV